MSTLGGGATDGKVDRSAEVKVSKMMEIAPQDKKQMDVVLDGVKRLYKTKLLPLEKAYKFGEFYSPLLSDADFDAAPMVMLLGQYSVGKTTFIKYLLEKDFMGMRIGPEPTTDRFTCVMYGRNERSIPGNALAADAAKPFQGLRMFGVKFLNHIECSELNSPILKKVTLIDTPGVLAGEKQRVGRAYDFPRVVKWFSQRCDRILILFDAHKLDVSDEMKRTIHAVRDNHDKIRVILNKADQVNAQQLMRVYGALMWSLGKVFETPEVLRVYIGSFWDEPYRTTENIPLFQKEREDLLSDLRSLPRNATLRKINELVKRTRYAKVHAYIINHLRGKFGFFSKQSTQEKLLKSLLSEFKTVAKKHGLPSGDFPDVNIFRKSLERFEIWKFPKLYEKDMEVLDGVIEKEIPGLMKILPMVEKLKREAEYKRSNGQPESASSNPFGPSAATSVEAPWAIGMQQKSKYDNMFHELRLTSTGKLTGANAKDFMLKSCLPGRTLGLVWELADMDKDGCLDSEEFSVLVYLLEALKSQTMTTVPQKLPLALIPPSKRGLVQAEETPNFV